jgi:hypothetical protein
MSDPNKTAALLRAVHDADAALLAGHSAGREALLQAAQRLLHEIAIYPEASVYPQADFDPFAADVRLVAGFVAALCREKT